MNNLKILFLVVFFLIQIVATAQIDEKVKITHQILSKTDTVAMKEMSYQFQINNKTNLSEAVKIMKLNGYPIEKFNPDGSGFVLKGFIDGRPVYNIAYNRIAAQTTSTDDVWGSSGFNLDGSGVEVGLWDVGAVYADHTSFREGTYGQRHAYFIDSTGTVNNHSTHVAGTIIADNDDYSSKGMANESVLYSRDSKNDYLEMTNAAGGFDSYFSTPLILSNHSYGVNPGWSYGDYRGVGIDSWYWFAEDYENEDPSFGSYNQISFDKDQIAFQAPYYTIVWAAGNDRGEGPEPNTQHYYWNISQNQWVLSTSYHPKDGGADGFDCLPPDATSKNIITVGAIDDISYGYQSPTDVKQDNTNFSVWGPTKDGRIKPDIVANGDGLYSTLPNNTFGSMSGTSMAAPNVTGSIALLLQHYKNTHSNTIPLASTIKAVVIHTADESGTTPGPDYKYGWGLLNTYKAAQLISQDQTKPTTIQEIDLPKEYGTQITFNNLYNDGSQPIKITLVWDDLPPVNFTTGPILMRDLDVRLIKGGVTYYPYKLNPASPSTAATTGDNNKDNVEQIYLQSPGAGYYTVVVSHKGTLSTNQKFSLITTGFIEPFVTFYLKQLGNDNQPFGQASYWDNSMWNSVSPTQSVTLSLDKHHFLSTQDFKPMTYEKFNIWEDNLSNKRYCNWDTLSLKSTTTQVLSKFIPKIAEITVKNGFENTYITGGTLMFKDPWLADITEPPYGLRNRGMDAPFKQRTSPFYPDYTTSYNGDVYKGVFLNQGWPSWQPPYYSVKANAVQDTNLNNTGYPWGRNHKFYFQNWSATSQGSAEFQNANALETPVVFKQANATVQANLKGTQLSNRQFAGGYGQRSFVRSTNGYLHNVYESMGDIWYERSTDNGVTWLLMNDGKPINPDYATADASSPSVCFDANYNMLYVVYQSNSIFPYNGIVLAQFNTSQNANTPNWVELLTTPDNYSYSNNYKPVVAAMGSGGVVVYDPPSSVAVGLKGLKFYIESSPGYELLGSNQFTIPGADQNSTNPSIVAGCSYYYLVYEQSQTSIRYLSWAGGSSPSGYTNISSGSSYIFNVRPTISLEHCTYPVVSWIGGTYDYYHSGFYQGSCVMTRVGPTWGSINIISASNTQAVNNNSTTEYGSEYKSVITYSYGSSTKWVKRDGGTYTTPAQLNYNNFPINGIWPQVSSGASISDMKALVYNSNSLPYYFIQSTTNLGTGLGKISLAKTSETDTIVTFGRSGVIDKNGVEFVFEIGDILVGDNIVKFIEVPDTIAYSTTEQLNKDTRTENFTLSPETDFYFSNIYSVVKKSNPDSALTSSDAVNFKAELVNALTNQVVGTFDNVTYNKNNLEKYASIDYQVDCSGINAGEYYLRLVTNVTGEANYTLANIVNDNTTLAKKSFNKVNFTGSEIPTTYDLAQNYPNPFNPRTTIRYQLPKDGLVTLKIYDILGSEIATLVNEEKIAGKYEINFSATGGASSLASGVYIYKIQAGDFTSSKKMILIK